MNQFKLLMALLFACCASLSFAQTTKVETELGQAKTKGLSFVTPNLFTADADLSKKSPLKQVVSKATYLQLDEQTLATTRQAQPEALRLQLPAANGKTLTLEMIRYDVTTPDFFVGTSSTNGQAVAYTPGAYYRGVVAGVSSSLVAVSIFDNEISAVISTPQDGKMVLNKLASSTARNGVQTDYAFYREVDLTVQNDFECGTTEIPDYGQRVLKYLDDFQPNGKMLDASNCVRVYFETDYALYQEKNSSTTDVSNWVTGMYNVVAAIYQNENINTTISQLYVWDTQDSYPSGSSDALNAFRAARAVGSFNGDLAHLLCRKAGTSGGIAWVDALCSSYRYAFSGINSSYSQLPSYSWTVDVVAHEMGHNLGSPHTHSCSWPNGAIDNCYTQEGSCNAGPDPGGPGTIMSYCHLTSNGKDLTLGFGTLPGDLIRNRVYNASCLTACNTGTPTCDDGLQNGDETGVDCGGTDCAACPTCDDGIQNGDETGVDCGGPDCAPCPCFDNEITFTITIDNYGNETSWVINDANGSQVAGAAAVYAGGSTTVENVCLPDGCYDLVVSDSYGDGICCAYGQGSYSLQDTDGTVLASGGEFGNSETTNFCLTEPVTPTCDDGIQNQGETGVDCGGPCAACPTCDDGVQNGNETGVDCGGDCTACPTCTDGVQNGAETGVDCGGPDCVACATCDDGVQNGNETGVDCGGDCTACATCDDGIQNQGEAGVDCGGPCAACPTCDDGVQNGNETGVDCGGDCTACATCDDNIQNGNETGVDCGGDCAACPTCDDGVQNGNETGVDCGGDCVACATCDDGIQNGGETGVDCGGDCTACATCDDGVQNGNETGVDCGGDCAACATCNDGILNGAETGVDCGGPDCGPCFTCDDGVQNGDETGVDCGGSCAACATCDDNIQNGTETGVDCGGDCAPCYTCEDGIQNGNETGVDCGGDCAACATCDDGVQNGNETGVDCGGDCVACATCTDGVQNGSETGVDCGGPDCAACPTCDDGVQNGNETGVDCGGDCTACATCTDGVQNGAETGVDCGGPDCAACPTCDDGIENGNETGIDCGGDCTACATCDDGIQNGNETGIDCGGDCASCATCDDGIQNGAETGVDCGGPDCAACATCDDGVQNGNETGVDCGGPDCAPCNTGCSIHRIDSNDFDSKWGIWDDGGSDCRRSANDAAYSNGGTGRSVRLRDNTSTSTTTTDNLDLTGYTELTVGFNYLARSMENNEDFWLQISTDGGATFTTVQSWARGTDFENNVREFEEVLIQGPFSGTTKLRFRADASGNSDWVYIDDVVIDGCFDANNIIAEEPVKTSSDVAPSTAAAPTQTEVAEEIETAAVTDFTLRPNPARDNFVVDFNLTAASDVQLSIISITGKVVEARNLGEIEGNQTLRFDATRYTPGYYFITLKTKDGITSNKFVIVR